LNINYTRRKCKNYKTLYKELKDNYNKDLNSNVEFQNVVKKYSKSFDFPINCRTLKTFIGTIQAYE